MVVIVDYGLGNLGSIANMIKKVGGNYSISSSPEDILKAEKLILPGVGAFDTGIENLHKLKLFEPLCQKILDDKIPVLGICLGMQLLTHQSEEGQLSGLGVINAYTRRFEKIHERFKIPHMGWNHIQIQKKSPLIDERLKDARFYFVHSYHVVCQNPEDILTFTEYGYPFVSSIQSGNLYGVQFHPEKSHRYGMRLIKNFIAL